MPKSPAFAIIAALAALSSSSMGDARHWLKAPAGRECIDLHGIRAETAEADDVLIIHTSGSRAYRNRLPQPCDGLRALNNVATLSWSSSGDQLCKGDRFQVGQGIVDSVIGRDDAPRSTRCTLGSFEPITEMSLTEALRR